MPTEPHGDTSARLPSPPVRCHRAFSRAGSVFLGCAVVRGGVYVCRCGGSVWFPCIRRTVYLAIIALPLGKECYYLPVRSMYVLLPWFIRASMCGVLLGSLAVISGIKRDCAKQPGKGAWTGKRVCAKQPGEGGCE